MQVYILQRPADYGQPAKLYLITSNGSLPAEAEKICCQILRRLKAAVNQYSMTANNRRSREGDPYSSNIFLRVAYFYSSDTFVPLRNERNFWRRSAGSPDTTPLLRTPVTFSDCTFTVRGVWFLEDRNPSARNDSSKA